MGSKERESAALSQRIRWVSSVAILPLAWPLWRQAGQRCRPLNSTSHNEHKNRPQTSQATTAFFRSWKKQLENPSSSLVSAGRATETGWKNAGQISTCMVRRQAGQAVGSGVLQAAPGNGRWQDGQGTDAAFISHFTAAAPGRGKANSRRRARREVSRPAADKRRPRRAGTRPARKRSPTPRHPSTLSRRRTREKTTD